MPRCPFSTGESPRHALHLSQPQRGSTSPMRRGVVLIGLLHLLVAQEWPLKTVGQDSREPTLSVPFLEAERREKALLHHLRVSIGVESLRPGSFADVLDQQLFPRPQRMWRRSNMASRKKRRAPRRQTASRTYIQSATNVFTRRDRSREFFVASFQSNHVYRVGPDGQPETFARGVYCDGVHACTVLDGPWGLESLDEELFVTSFASDEILIFNVTDSSFIGRMGGSELLRGPEGLAISPHDGLLYVASFLGGVSRFSPTQRLYVDEFLSADIVAGPEGLSFFPDGSLAVACHSDHTVRIFNAHGQQTHIISNTTHPSMRGPTGVAVLSLPSGGSYLAVSCADTSHSVLVFQIQPAGRVAFAGIVDSGPRIKSPAGLAAVSGEHKGDGGHLLVSSYDTHRVLIYSLDKLLQQSVGDRAAATTAEDVDAPKAFGELVTYVRL